MSNIRRIIKNQKGVTLVALVITIVLMVILTITVTINVGQLTDVRKKSGLVSDINALNEEISQYYTRTKKLPVINEYKNVDMLASVRNVNDNDKYYVINIEELDVKLNFGNDYNYIKQVNKSIPIPTGTSFTDVYIVNEQSHTVYYPKGINSDEQIYYRIGETYSNVIGQQNAIE